MAFALVFPQAQAIATAQSPAVGHVTDACHVSPIVQDLDRSVRFYRDLLGLEVSTPGSGPIPWSTDPGHLAMHGLPRARVRVVTARMPGVRCGVELVEFGNVDRRPVQRRMQDIGAPMLILIVRDIDAAFATLKKANVPIVTTGGAPISMSETSKTRAVVVKDPDGHFVELAQLDPVPQTTVPAASNVIGMRFRITVSDVERTIAYYQRTLGIENKVPAFSANPRVMRMTGLPENGAYRVTMATLPGSSLILEFMEFRSLAEPGRAVTSRLQDPGSYRLQLTVRDINPVLRALTTEGTPVVSTGAAPVTMTVNARPWRLAVAQDPNNLFLVVQQPVQTP